MKYRIYITIIAVFILSGCGLLSEIFTQNENTRIQESFAGIDSDLWDEFVRLSNLPNCQLPCWWGLELGEVELSEVLTFIEEREFDRYQERQAIDDTPPEVWIRYDGYSLEFTGRGATTGIGDVDYFFSFDDDNMLRTIYLTMRSPDRWLLDESNPLLVSNVLDDLETMPTVLIGASHVSRISDFSLFLIYPDEGLQIHHFMDISEDYPLICLSSETIKESYLTITNYPNNLVEVSDTFIPIEGSWLVQDSSITTEEFVQFFRDNPNSCLDLSQYPQGE